MSENDFGLHGSRTPDDLTFDDPPETLEELMARVDALCAEIKSQRAAQSWWRRIKFALFGWGP